MTETQPKYFIFSTSIHINILQFQSLFLLLDLDH
jgi:hypothetical protein